MYGALYAFVARRSELRSKTKAFEESISKFIIITRGFKLQLFHKSLFPYSFEWIIYPNAWMRETKIQKRQGRENLGDLPHKIEQSPFFMIGHP